LSGTDRVSGRQGGVVVLAARSSGRWLLGSALLLFGLFFIWAPLFFDTQGGPQVLFHIFAVFGTGFGIAYLAQRSSIVFDEASAQVEQITTIFGIGRPTRTPLAQLDRVSLEAVDKGPFTEFALLLRGRAASLRLESGVDCRDRLFDAGVSAALATGLPFEETQEDGAVTRLSPAQLAELASAPEAAQIPWWRRPSAVALVMANLVPLAGVLLAGWQVLPLLLLFWLENVVIGVFTVCKILLAQGKEGASPPLFARLPIAGIFIFHYGAFAVGHGTLILELFDDHGGGFTNAFFVTELPRLVFYVLRQHGLFWAALALFISHAVTFYTEFLGPRRHEGLNPAKLLFAPYKRVVLLHGLLLVGALVIQAFGSKVLLLALMVLVKIAIDLGGHLREHRAAPAAA